MKYLTTVMLHRVLNSWGNVMLLNCVYVEMSPPIIIIIMNSIVLLILLWSQLASHYVQSNIRTPIKTTRRGIDTLRPMMMGQIATHHEWSRFINWYCWKWLKQNFWTCNAVCVQSKRCVLMDRTMHLFVIRHAVCSISKFSTREGSAAARIKQSVGG